jgi:hypothetical protein
MMWLVSLGGRAAKNISGLRDIWRGKRGSFWLKQNNQNLWTRSGQNGAAQKGWVLVEREEVQ